MWQSHRCSHLNPRAKRSITRTRAGEQVDPNEYAATPHPAPRTKPPDRCMVPEGHHPRSGDQLATPEQTFGRARFVTATRGCSKGRAQRVELTSPSLAYGSRVQPPHTGSDPRGRSGPVNLWACGPQIVRLSAESDTHPGAAHKCAAHKCAQHRMLAPDRRSQPLLHSLVLRTSVLACIARNSQRLTKTTRTVFGL